MTPLDFFVVLGAAGVCTLIIWASLSLKSDVWHICPRCLQWHNQHGDVRALPPCVGRIESRAKFCPRCKRETA
jgi:hypothetical protein